MFLDKVTAAIAPFYCLSCSKIGYIVCPECQELILDKHPSRCYRCHSSTLQHQVCPKCRSASGLNHVWIVASYDGLPKDSVEVLKFERAGAASRDIARVLADILPLLPEETIVCHIPTASSRIRTRGYDQSKLIARRLAKLKGFSYHPLLNRISSTRQLGAGRKQRFEQAKNAFAVKSKFDITGKPILIIDDVTTSGATIEAAAALLKKAGAKTIDAAVFAQAVD